MDLIIEKSIELEAPISKVWAAITDYKQFGRWFRAEVESPFTLGEKSRCLCRYPGLEHLSWDQTIVAMEPMTYFAFRWPHCDMETGEPYSAESITLVEFKIEEIPSGTRVTIIESGFEVLPDDRQMESFRNNIEGWNIQATNLVEYLESF